MTGRRMDIVYIRDLKIETVIGVFDWERQIRQMVSLDVEMATDNPKAAATDQIEDALDYGIVSQRLVSFVEASNFKLMETLAEKITEIILNEFNVPWVKLRLSKLGAIRGSKDVGIIIERSQVNKKNH